MLVIDITFLFALVLPLQMLSFGFFTRWIHERNSKDLGNVPSGAGLGFGLGPVKFAHLHDLHFPICVSGVYSVESKVWNSFVP